MGLREELQTIRDDVGALNDEVVVEAARPVEHPLHHRFEWDDTKAGQRYRLAQAAALIRMARVDIPEHPERSVRAFVPVYRSEKNRNDYTPVEEVMTDPLLAALTLKQAEREWRQMLARYEHLVEFRDIVRRDVA